jgi:hypothetical protein
MTSPSSPDCEPNLADVQREFPSWECWRGASGLYYARHHDTPRSHGFDVQGEDPLDLRDMIRGWIGRNEK